MTVVTALNPVIGYENASRLAKHVLANGGAIAESARALGILSEREIADRLVPEMLTQPG